MPAEPAGQAAASEKKKDQSSQDQSQKSADPFADLSARAPAPAPESDHSRLHSFFYNNFGFRKELMSEFDINGDGNGASRQSAGFEVLKKFSTATSTIASFDFQARLVRRDGFNPVLNDMEGQNRQGWTFEYHNLYLDLYNVFNPLMRDDQRSQQIGRFNARMGRFYVPFGLNLQTDTHGTVLQLSNERNFGFERDWYVGFWGALTKHLNYDVYYLVGSGYDLKFKGQKGLVATRISLANEFSSAHGFEGGLSILAGERLTSHMSSLAAGALSSKDQVARVETRRYGVDARYKRPLPGGTFILTSEISGGQDVPATVFMQLYQADYLHSSRQWGLATQYRRFSDNRSGADAALFGEVTWYFRNDISNSNLHWIKLNVGRHVERPKDIQAWIVTLQYYFYW